MVAFAAADIFVAILCSAMQSAVSKTNHPLAAEER
jgi:hypothetical protein